MRTSFRLYYHARLPGFSISPKKIWFVLARLINRATRVKARHQVIALSPKLAIRMVRFKARARARAIDGQKCNCHRVKYRFVTLSGARALASFGKGYYRISRGDYLAGHYETAVHVIRKSIAVSPSLYRRCLIAYTLAALMACLEVYYGTLCLP